jgi:signal transduction histidine kinase
MTNALKHGHAKKITIAVRFSEHSVDIIIADNGVGCEEFTKGNGIKGMEQRVKELDGFFSCGSPDGEGFNLHVTIPIIRELTNINDVEMI